MEKKYKLTDETIEIDGKTLHRIEALRNFVGVRKGDKGGYVESEENLSHLGNCWIYDDACVFGEATVFGYAMVYSKARVFDKAEVFDHAEVFGNAWVYNHAKVGGNTRLGGNVEVCGNTEVWGKARITGEARIGSDAVNESELTVHKHEWYTCTRYLIFNPHGSVMLDIINGWRTPLIWDLWVSEPSRRSGLATKLLDKAEEIAASLGYAEVRLEWDKRDTPQWVHDWYVRRGYKEIQWDEYISTLYKRLKGGEK